MSTKIKFEINTGNEITSRSGIIEQNGFSSFKLIPWSSDGLSLEQMIVDGTSDVRQSILELNNEATSIKDSVLGLSTNLSTNYLSKVELYSDDGLTSMISSVSESSATFVRNDQAGQWYGLNLATDINGKKYITGFDIGAIVNPNSGSSDSYFRVNADRFIVGSDLGDGAFSGPLDAAGEPIPAFAIVQNELQEPEILFNGKVTISSIPKSVNKNIGNFDNITSLNIYLQANPDIILTDGDTYFNSTDNTIYSWNGNSWISNGARVEVLSIVFSRSSTKPSAPSGGNYQSPIPTTFGWLDGIPAIDASKDAQDPVWWSSAYFDNKTDYTIVQPIWSEPVIASDTETQDIMYNSSLTTPASPTYNGDLTSVSVSDAANGWYNTGNTNSVWSAIRIKRRGVWSSWSVYRIRGEEGSPGDPGERGSAILTGSLTDTSAMTSLFNSKFGSVKNGDQYISSSNSGTEIYTYENGIWAVNTALRINGNAIIDGTLYVSGNNITAGTIVGSALQVAGSNSWGTTGTMYVSNIAGVGSIYCTDHINTSRLTVRTGISAIYGSTEARYVNTGGYGGGGAGNEYGISTGTYKAYIGGGVAPFTGVHIGYSKDKTLSVGDIVSSSDAWVVSIEQTLVHLEKSNENDKRVFGVVSSINQDVLSHILQNTMISDEEKKEIVIPALYSEDGIMLEESRIDIVGTGNWTIKEIFKSHVDNLVHNEFIEVSVNSIGEGGINVCEINGDIFNGDFICASSIKGKGMKQNDDLMHSYTVAKALESVVWKNEVVGQNGCFEQDGYICKTIACTYHCG